METFGLSKPLTPLCFSRLQPFPPSSSSAFLPAPSSRFRPPSKPLRLLYRPPSSSLTGPSNPQCPQNLSEAPSSLSSFIRPLAIAIAATAILFSRFQKPSMAVSVPPPPTVESKEDSVSDAEKEKTLEEYAESHPDDVSGLKALVEVKVKLQKLAEAIDVVDRLCLLQPQEKEWPLMRAHLYLYSGDTSTAKSLFEEIIAEDPFRVEAYHGLMMTISQTDPDSLEQYLKRVDEVMHKCKKEKKEDLRDFKLLVAQVRVTQGKYEDALTLYKGLVKEEPRDFRPYLCMGIIYTLLRRMDEAEKQFEKYKRLVPKGHPYAQYFNDNVVATKVFAQMRDNELADSKR